MRMTAERRLSIAVDFDGTFNADPHLWMNFMQMARTLGHNPFIVTFRDDDYDFDPLLRDVAKNDFKVYYTKGVAKRWWCQHYGPGEVDIWIDDTPEAIIENSKLTVEQVAAWRAR